MDSLPICTLYSFLCVLRFCSVTLGSLVTAVLLGAWGGSRSLRCQYFESRLLTYHLLMGHQDSPWPFHRWPLACFGRLKRFNFSLLLTMTFSAFLEKPSRAASTEQKSDGRMLTATTLLSLSQVLQAAQPLAQTQAPWAQWVWSTMYLEPAASLGLKDSRENVSRNEERKDSKYPAVGIE